MSQGQNQISPFFRRQNAYEGEQEDLQSKTLIFRFVAQEAIQELLGGALNAATIAERTQSSYRLDICQFQIYLSSHWRDPTYRPVRTD